MAKLIYDARSSVTGKELGMALGIDYGTDCTGRVDKLIRWGNRTRVARMPGKTLNKKDALDSFSDKRNALNILQNAGIKIPPPADHFEGKLLVGRTSAHMQGNGFYLITSPRDFELAQHLGCTHYMEYIPCKREYRIHVFGDEVVAMSEKRMSNDATSLTIRNFETGWKFKYLDTVNDSIKNIAIDSILASQYDFGAVDILVSMSDTPYVLEINSSPSLCRIDENQETAYSPAFEIYVSKFEEFLNG